MMPRFNGPRRFGARPDRLAALFGESDETPIFRPDWGPKESDIGTTRFPVIDKSKLWDDWPDKKPGLQLAAANVSPSPLPRRRPEPPQPTNNPFDAAFRSHPLFDAAKRLEEEFEAFPSRLSSDTVKRLRKQSEVSSDIPMPRARPAADIPLPRPRPATDSAVPEPRSRPAPTLRDRIDPNRPTTLEELQAIPSKGLSRMELQWLLAEMHEAAYRRQMAELLLRRHTFAAQRGYDPGMSPRTRRDSLADSLMGTFGGYDSPLIADLVKGTTGSYGFEREEGLNVIDTLPGIGALTGPKGFLLGTLIWAVMQQEMENESHR